jgi:stage III sporulation protein AE
MKRAFLLIAVCLLLTGICHAEDLVRQEADILNTDSLYGGLSPGDTEKLEGASPSAGADFGSQLWKVISDSLSGLQESFADGLKSACGMLAAAVLCAAADGLDTRLSKSAVLIAGTLAITAICAGSLHGMIGLAADTLDRIANFTELLLPVLSSAAAASGAVSASAALYVGSSLFMSMLTSVIRSLLIPLVCAFTALCAAESALEQNKLAGLRKLLGWVIQISLRAVMYLFTAYLALTGVLSSSADAVTLKAAKATLSGALPVVGGIASDATETVLAGAGLLKNSVGIFGMLAVLAIGLTPFFKIAAAYLSLKLVTAVSAVSACREHAQLLENLTTAMGYMLAMTGSAMLMTLVSCACFIKVVSG